MKFTDTTTAQDSIPTVLAETPWAAEILEKLRTNNLSSRDRIRYKDALIQKLSQKSENEAYEENLKKVQQEVEELKAQQKSTITVLLQEGLFSDERIAEILDVDVEYVKQIKNGLDS